MLARAIVEWCTSVIHSSGYLGAGFLMALESMIAPVPSEAVMPPVGILVKRGAFDLWAAIVACSLGSIIGSLVSYFVGFWGGRSLVLCVGRYLFLDREHLDWTERWFQKYGNITIFIGRFIPVVRHLISIPAGMGKMNLVPFVFYTITGATIWNSILLFLGYKFATYEEQIWEYSHRLHIDAVIGAAIVLLLLYFLFKHVFSHLSKEGRRSSGI